MIAFCQIKKPLKSILLVVQKGVFLLMNWGLLK